MELVNGMVQLKPNTKLVFLNMTIGLHLPKSIHFQELREFAKKFPNFLSFEPQIKKKENKTKFSDHQNIYLRYNRVSSFANMNDIMVEIDKLKSPPQNLDDKSVIYIIMEKFQRTEEEAKHDIIEWKKRYSEIASKKIDSSQKLGIRIQILQDKILLDGITQFYQIPEIYRFITFVLYLFIHKDDSEIKNHPKIKSILENTSYYDKNKNEYRNEMNFYMNDFRNNIQNMNIQNNSFLKAAFEALDKN